MVGLKFLANLRLKKNHLSKIHHLKAIVISVLIAGKGILLALSFNDCEFCALPF